MNTLTDIRANALVPAAAGSSTQPTLALNLPLPAGLAQFSASQPGQPLTLTVITTASASAPSPPGVPANSTAAPSSTLQLPDGTTVSARLNPPLPAGSQLQLSPAALAQLVGKPAASPAAPGMAPAPTANQTTPQTATVSLRLLSTPPTPQSTPTSSPAAPPLPTNLTLTSLTPIIPTTAAAAPPPLTLPAGPVLLTLPGGTAASLPVNAPVTITVTDAPDPTGAQPVRLVTPQPTTGPQVTLKLTTGLPLPSGTQLTLFPTQPSANIPTGQVPALLLQPQTLSGPTPATPPTSQQPAPSPTLGALRLLTTTGQPVTSPQLAAVLGPVTTARVLTPSPSTTSNSPALPSSDTSKVQQNILLPNGLQLVIESPQGVQQGSLLTMQLTATLPNILRLITPFTLAPTPQNITQPAATSLFSTPANTTGVVQGIITAQLPASAGQSQVQFTVSSPGPWQGQSISVALPPHTAANTSLPLGTQLTLQLYPGGQAQVLATELPQGFTHTQAITTLGQGWPGLQRLMQVLPALLPSLSHQLGQRLPNLRAMAPTLLTYIDGIQSNSPERTFGADTIAFARAMGIDLSDDIQQLHQLQQPAAQNLQQGLQQTTEPWRGLIFPFQEAPGTAPQQGRFFWRRQGKGNDSSDEATTSNTRFVVELSLSRLGDLQLDGLLNYPHIWLKLRLKKPPPESLTGSLHALVSSTLQATGLEGGLVVEQTGTFPLDPAAEMLAESTGMPGSASGLHHTVA